MEKDLKIFYKKLVKDVAKEVLKTMDKPIKVSHSDSYYDKQVLEALCVYGANGVSKREFENVESLPSAKVVNKSLGRLINNCDAEMKLVRNGKKGRPVKFIRACNLCVDL